MAELYFFVLIAPTPSPFGSRDGLSLTASKLQWNEHDHVRMLLQWICDPFWLKSGQKARRPFKAFGPIDGRAARRLVNHRMTLFSVAKRGAGP